MFTSKSKEKQVRKVPNSPMIFHNQWRHRNLREEKSGQVLKLRNLSKFPFYEGLFQKNYFVLNVLELSEANEQGDWQPKYNVNTQWRHFDATKKLGCIYFALDPDLFLLRPWLAHWS